MVIFGTRLMGKSDQVPGLFHVATRFFHIDFVPLIPTATYLVFSQNGSQFRGIKIPMAAKSLFLTWGRFITFVAGVIGLVVAMVTFNKPGSSADWMGPAAIGVSCSVAFVFLRWHRVCTHASYSRACQLAQMVGLNAAGLQMIQQHFGQSAGRGFEVQQPRAASFAPQQQPPKPAPIPLAPPRPLQQPEWFFESNGQQSGPVAFETLRQMITNGQLSPQTLVWKEGLANWTEAGQVRGLFTPPAMGGVGQTA